MLILPDEWKQLWHDLDPFEQVFALKGQEFRNMDGRCTLRFELLGTSYFVKRYSGLGWGRIFGSLMRFRLPPVSTARNEWQAIQALTKLGIDTMTTVAYGERGRSPASRQSFLVTEDLNNTESLEDFCRDWTRCPPSPRLKRALISRIAKVSAALHNAGMNHRDYYLCHFLLDISCGRDNINPDNFHLYLIDLHRVQFRRTIPDRSRFKDLSALYFSAMEIGLTQRDYRRFLREYAGEPLRVLLKKNPGLWQRIIRRGEQLQRRFNRKYRA